MIRRDSLWLWMVVAGLLISVLFGESQGLAVGPDRLGASLDDAGMQVTFRVFSSRATRVEVCLYNHPFGDAEKANMAIAFGDRIGPSMQRSNSTQVLCWS